MNKYIFSKKTVFFNLFLKVLVFYFLIGAQLNFQELRAITPEKKRALKQFFQKTDNKFSNESIVTHLESLKKITKRTLSNLQELTRTKNDSKINSIIFNNHQEYLSKTKKTLEFLLSLKPGSKINSNFLNVHFNLIKWNGDSKSAISDGKSLDPGSVLLTKYLIYRVNGSRHKTKEFPSALYEVPHDEKNLSKSEIEKRKSSLLRFKYSKQEVFNGALEKKHYRNLLKPLAWLRTQDVDQAILQGSVVVDFPDGKSEVFNFVHGNKMPYNRKIKHYCDQKTYGFFKKASCINRNLKNANNISNFLKFVPWVTFAGDKKNIGYGQLIAIKYTNSITKKPEIRLGILADTGGAFVDNLYQLDYYTGIFKSKKDFLDKTKGIAREVEAFILVKK